MATPRGLRASAERSRGAALGALVVLLPTLALSACGGGDGLPDGSSSSRPGATASRSITPPTLSVSPTRSLTASPERTRTEDSAPEPDRVGDPGGRDVLG